MLGELVPDAGAAPDAASADAAAPPASAQTPLPNPLPAARGEGIGAARGEGIGAAGGEGTGPVDVGAETVVTATTPLHGSRLPRDRVPANVQTVTADAIAASATASTLRLHERTRSAASRQPGPGEPAAARPAVPRVPRVAAARARRKGLSVYLDGVRLNEPFGDTRQLGPDPARGDPFRQPHARLEPAVRAEHAGRRAVARDQDRLLRSGRRGSHARGIVRPPAAGRRHRRATASAGACSRRGASSARRAGGHFRRRARRARSSRRRYRNGATTADLSLTAADTTLTGNGPAPRQLLALDRRAIFTHPDRTDNRTVHGGRARRAPAGRRSRSCRPSRITARSRIATVNGDQADWIGCQDPARAGSVCASDEAGAEAPVSTPPATRPVRRATRTTPPTTRPTRASRATASPPRSPSTAPVAGRENHLFVGAAADEGRAGFASQSALASLSTEPRHGAERHRRRRIARRRRQRDARPRPVRHRHVFAAPRICS